MTNEELELAVADLTLELDFADQHEWLTLTVSADDLRLLLSERAELLAAVERMREALEWIADRPYPRGAQRDIARAALTTGEATSTEQGERG